MLQKAKKFCGVLMALAILTTMLAGCDSKSNKSQNSVDGTSSVAAANNLDPLSGEGKNGTIQLKVWAPDAAVSIFNKQCKAFIEKYKDFGTIKISVVPQGEADAATSVLTDPDSAADVFGFACDNIDKLQATDSLLPIVGNDKTKTEEENIKAAVDAATINGKLYAYPETGDNSYCLVYDNSVVSDEEAKTLEGVLKACKAANKKFVMDAGSGYYACLFLFTGGVRLEGYEKDNLTQKFNDYDEQTVLKTMMTFRNLFMAYKDYFLNGDTTKVVDGFKSNTVGAGFDGSWNFKSIKDTLGERAGFSVLPTINVDGEDRQIINMFGYKLIGINAFTKYPATANELAKYLASEECQ